MMGWYGHMNGWGYALMTGGTILFWALVIVGVIVLVRYLTRTPHTPEGVTPERILAERFAHGEIDEQEYQSRLAILRGGRRPAGHP